MCAWYGVAQQVFSTDYVHFIADSRGNAGGQLTEEHSHIKKNILQQSEYP